jgi:hypothetical protein
MTRKLAGLDITGWRDHAVRTWRTADEDEPVADPVTLDGGLGSVVIRTGEGPPPDAPWSDEGLTPMGGPQAALAPHGRGGGWGDIGRADRRMTVRAALADLSRPGGDERRAATAVAAACAALAAQAHRIVLAIPDDEGFDEAAQEAVAEALTAARFRSAILLRRSLALVLGALEGRLLPEASQPSECGLIVHTPAGIVVDRLVVRRDGRTGVMAPERRRPARGIVLAVGLDALLREAEDAIAAQNRDALRGALDGARLPLLLTLGAAEREEIVRAKNGDWVRLTAPDAPARVIDIAALEGVATTLDDCTAVLVDTPLAGAARDAFVAAAAAALGRDVVALPHDTAARGALAAAQRVEAGLPFAFEVLPQISVLAARRGEGVDFRPLIDADEALPVHATYRSRVPVEFAWPRNLDHVTLFVEREGSPHVRALRLEMPPAPVYRAVQVTLEQRPSQGHARLELSSPDWPELNRRGLRPTWASLQDDPRSRDELIVEHQTPPPGYPDRMVLPASLGAWILPGEEGRSFEAWLALGRTHDPNWFDALAKMQSGGVAIEVEGEEGWAWQRIKAVDSDGAVPAGVDPAPLLRALDAAQDRLMGAVRTGLGLGDNSELKFCTWCFSKCPDAIKDQLIVAARNAGHPWRGPQSSGFVIWQGIGRTFDDRARIRTAFELLKSLDAAGFKNQQRASLAFLLSRRDEAIDELSEQDVETFALLLCATMEAELGAYGPKYKYLLMAVGGLLRARRRWPALLLPDGDSWGALGARMGRSLDRSIGLMPRQIANAQTGVWAQETLKHLRGEGGDPAILVSIGS